MGWHWDGWTSTWYWEAEDGPTMTTQGASTAMTTPQRVVPRIADAWPATEVSAMGNDPSVQSDVRRFGPNTAVVSALIADVRQSRRDRIVRLDLIERRQADLLLVGWDHIRDRLRADPWRAWRFAARGSAWRGAVVAARRHGLHVPADDGYWRVEMGVGVGFARVARYTACALVAPELLDPELLDVILRPWRSVVEVSPP